MGVSETMVSTAVAGMIFSLLCGQPLMLIGATGPVLVFEQSLYSVRNISFCAFLNLYDDFIVSTTGFWLFFIFGCFFFLQRWIDKETHTAYIYITADNIHQGCCHF